LDPQIKRTENKAKVEVKALGNGWTLRLKQSTFPMGTRDERLGIIAIQAITVLRVITLSPVLSVSHASSVMD
jgi:hypothetical protein